MSRRIGELLLDKGLITAVQLDQALRSQLFFGGHLGTCLIELGFVSQDDLGHALAELLGLAYAGDAELDGVPDEVIRIFDTAMVEKYRAIPLRLEDKTLHLAVIDPKSLGRLSALTGYRLIPWVTPESRLLEAMETHYGIQRSARYVRLSRGMVRQVPDELFAAGPGPGAADEAASGGDAGEPAVGSEADLEFGYGRPWREVAGELLDDDVRPSESVAPAEPRAPVSIYQRMSRAEDKHELARLVLAYLAERMRGAILFTVRANTAAVWDSVGLEFDRERSASLRFPVSRGSLFELMLGDGHYRGPLPDRPSCRWVHAALGLDPPEEMLLLPVYLNERLVAVIYGDGGRSGEIRGSTELFVRLALKLGLGLSMLVLKIKIAS
ncbi:MAG TPA: hypothetical protein VD788_04855 [Candidatus Polarisedimenticolaceae bacterium]|nr:hypothetical protein [Candidatus Polarisedimenticolaceae bacterium]